MQVLLGFQDPEAVCVLECHLLACRVWTGFGWQHLCAVCSPREAPAVPEAPHGWLEIETLAPEGLLSVPLRPPWKQDVGMLSVFQAWSEGTGFKLLLSLLLLLCWEHAGGSVLVILRQLLAGKILGQEAGSDCFPLKILQGGIQGCLGRRDLLSKINASSSSVFLEYLQAS